MGAEADLARDTLLVLGAGPPRVAVKADVQALIGDMQMVGAIFVRADWIEVAHSAYDQRAWS
eukprot:10702427-Lingulodinium_polyedra.AAC.1